MKEFALTRLKSRDVGRFNFVFVDNFDKLTIDSKTKNLGSLSTPVFEVVWTLINVVSVYAVFIDFKATK